MKRSRLIHIAVILLLVAGLVPAYQPAVAQPAAQEINLDTPFVPGEVVVSFSTGLTTRTYRARASALAGKVGAAVVQQYSNMALLSFSPDMDVPEAVQQIASMAGVVVAQPNYVYTLPEAASNLLGDMVYAGDYRIKTASGVELAFPWQTLQSLRTRITKSGKTQVVPAFPRELSEGIHWGFTQVKTDLIWRDNAAQVVCLLDTGVDTAHFDLSGKFLAGFDFVNSDSIPNDDNGHGTHIAGIITAKVNNSDGTAMGVSNAKVIPVKVLNAQGFGTSYSVAAGIRYCSNRTEPRVLNLSLGSWTPGILEYNALKTFIQTKGRLVVAAAGNSSTSDYFYPAAWADPTVKGPGGAANDLYAGLISVAGGRAPSAYPIWVDRDGNNQIRQSDDPAVKELFYAEECASGAAQTVGAFGTNYGSWIDIVAPGDSIYSTTPTSYPFYLNYYYQAASGYASMSGTSMAAGFVSGAAARVYRLPSMSSNALVKKELIKWGQPLSYAVDPQVADATAGFNNQTGKIDKFGNPVLYGVPFLPIGGSDPNTDSVVLAPYCWPTESGPFQQKQDMSSVKYLDIASAMNRMALMAEVKDAFSGLPVAGATVTMVNAANVSRGNAVTAAATSYVVVLNIPADNTYKMRVNKTGSTTGAQEFNSDVVGQRGKVIFDAYSTVSLPNNTGMHFVLDWRDPGLNPNEWRDPNMDPELWPEPIVDFDMYLRLPVVTVSGTPLKTMVGPWDARGLWPHFDLLDLGTLLNPKDFGGTFSPYALHKLDGGKEVAVDKEGRVISPVESISMRQGAAITGSPYYRPKYKGNYYVYITDPNSSGSNSNLKLYDRDDPRFTAPIFRYWTKGYIKGIARLDAGCNGSREWWRPMRLNGTTIDVTDSTNKCVGVSPLDPY
jgi:subtilisin family serine protease